MTNADIIKLRRFCLTFGLILITFSLAGVEMESPARISPLGIPLTIKRPDLLGIGLVLGAAYSLFRYWYYGILVGLSPRKARKRLKSGTLVDGAVTVGGSSGIEDSTPFYEEASRSVFPYNSRMCRARSESGR